MANIVKKAVLGATLAATALTAAAPAEAQRWRRYDRGRGGDVAAGAVIGGLVGLGVGAAIASANRDRFYDRRFRRGWRGDRFYAPRRFYGDPRFGYGGPGFGYGDPRFVDPRFGWNRGFGGGWGGRCYTVRDFDPYTGRRFRTRICD